MPVFQVLLLWQIFSSLYAFAIYASERDRLKSVPQLSANLRCSILNTGLFSHVQPQPTRGANLFASHQFNARPAIC